MKMRPKLVQRKGLFRHDGFCTEFFFFGHGGWLKLSWQVVKNVRGSMAEKHVFAFLVPWKALHVRLREHVGRINVHVEMETYVKPTNWECPKYSGPGSWCWPQYIGIGVMKGSFLFGNQRQLGPKALGPFHVEVHFLFVLHQPGIDLVAFGDVVGNVVRDVVVHNPY